MFHFLLYQIPIMFMIILRAAVAFGSFVFLPGDTMEEIFSPHPWNSILIASVQYSHAASHSKRVVVLILLSDKVRRKGGGGWHFAAIVPRWTSRCIKVTSGGGGRKTMGNCTLLPMLLHHAALQNQEIFSESGRDGSSSPPDVRTVTTRTIVAPAVRL